MANEGWLAGWLADSADQLNERKTHLNSRSRSASLDVSSNDTEMVLASRARRFTWFSSARLTTAAASPTCDNA